MKKVIFVASSGGHLTEMLALDPLFKEYDYLLVTEKTEVTLQLQNQYHMDYLQYGPTKNIFKYMYYILLNIKSSITILRKVRPDTVITTGAQVGGIFLFLAKFFKAKTIYIESLARTKTLSKTGKVAYHFTDIFFVQWQSLLKKYPKARYLGRVM